MFKTLAVLSLTPQQTLKLEGYGYSNKTDAKKHIEYFKALSEKTMEIENKFFNRNYNVNYKRYFIKEIEIDDSIKNVPKKYQKYFN